MKAISFKYFYIINFQSKLSRIYFFVNAIRHDNIDRFLLYDTGGF